jgi:hypothetical protein
MPLLSPVPPRFGHRPPQLERSGRHGPVVALFSRGKRLAMALLLMVSILFSGLQPVHADAGRFLAGSDYAELSAELAALQPDPAAAKAPVTAAQLQRLADLEALERQIARSDDRAQLRNRTAHNLGLFARSKKEPADQQPSFYVLAPGHSSDDDFDLVALLIPAGVSLSWGDGGQAAAISTGPRVVRVLEGQQVVVREPAAPAEVAASPLPNPSAAAPAAGVQGPSAAVAPLTYQLSQPPFQVLSRWEPQPTLPNLSQAALDLEPETAPLD